MDKIRKLLAEKDALVKATQAILDANAELSAEQQATVDANLAKVEALNQRIKTQEKLNAEVAAAPAVAIANEEEADIDPKKVRAAVTSEPLPFRSFGDQLQAIVNSTKTGAVDERLLKVQAAASGQNEKVDSEGGFLVQPDFAAGIRQKMFDTGNIASRVQRLPISASSNGIKLNALKETSRADGSRHGGVRVYWKEEAAQATTSKMKLRQMSLELKKLIALTYVTDELLQDSVALDARLFQLMAEAVTFKVEDGVVRGTGAGQPLGIINSPALISVSAESGQAADTIKFENVSKMWARMIASSRPNAVWLINQEIEPQLDLMSVPVGTGGVPVYLPAGGVSASPFATLKGRPVIPVEYCSALGDVGDIILADFTQYLMIDKGGAKTSSSMHIRFDYDETAFKVTYRCDGQPEWDAPLTPYKGASTLSPFVALAAR